MQVEHEGQTLTVFKGTDSALLPTYALPCRNYAVCSLNCILVEVNLRPYQVTF